MRDREVTLSRGARLSAGVEADRVAWLELVASDGRATTLELTEEELLMAIEALAMVYASVVGANPASVARGLHGTLSNRTRAARERRRLQRWEAS